MCARDVMRLELLNQLDGFDDRGDVKVGLCMANILYEFGMICGGHHGHKSHRVPGSCNDPTRRPLLLCC